jgi:hypothetical protein
MVVVDQLIAIALRGMAHAMKTHSMRPAGLYGAARFDSAERLRRRREATGLFEARHHSF